MVELVTVKAGNWTKDEEVKAIQEFVNQLPKDSYLASILEGVVEYCEQHIRNDCAWSIMEELNDTHGKVIRMLNETAELRSQLKQSKEETAAVQRALNSARQHITEQAGELKAVQAELGVKGDEIYTLREVVQQKARAVVELKATIYDLLKEKGAV